MTILARLGGGGMGEVLLAVRRGAHGFEKPVALKLIRRDLLGYEQMRRMFLDEARLLARLAHPAIAQVIDFAEEDGVLYLTMEYVQGVPLFALTRKRRGPLEPGIVARMSAEICRGLHAAHELTDREGRPLGVVHRDMSPQNVMLTFDGHIKILDFGVAFARERQAEETRTGFVKGKLAYAAPEQIAGVDVDRRADLYGVGVVMHEMLTGRRLFRDDAGIVVDAGRRGTPAPPSSVVPGLPPELDRIVMTALAVQPGDRYADARAMAQALDEHLSRNAGESLESFAERELAEDRRTHDQRLRALFDAQAAPAVSPSSPEAALAERTRLERGASPARGRAVLGAGAGAADADAGGAAAGGGLGVAGGGLGVAGLGPATGSRVSVPDSREIEAVAVSTGRASEAAESGQTRRSDPPARYSPWSRPPAARSRRRHSAPSALGAIGFVLVLSFGAFAVLGGFVELPKDPAVLGVIRDVSGRLGIEGPRASAIDPTRGRAAQVEDTRAADTQGAGAQGAGAQGAGAQGAGAQGADAYRTDRDTAASGHGEAGVTPVARAAPLGLVQGAPAGSGAPNARIEPTAPVAPVAPSSQGTLTIEVEPPEGVVSEVEEDDQEEPGDGEVAGGDDVAEDAPTEPRAPPMESFGAIARPSAAPGAPRPQVPAGSLSIPSPVLSAKASASRPTPRPAPAKASAPRTATKPAPSKTQRAAAPPKTARPQAPASAGVARLSVDARAGGVLVIDGKKVGTTPLRSLKVRAGWREVSLWRPGDSRARWHSKVMLHANKHLRITLR